MGQIAAIARKLLYQLNFVMDIMKINNKYCEVDIETKFNIDTK